jgi:hypothetical protein
MREHKKQLHERIMKRQSQLLAQREKESGRTHTARTEREIALDDALAMLEIHLATGWDNVDDLSAEELSRWLESTRFLVDQAAGGARAAAIRRRTQARSIRT